MRPRAVAGAASARAPDSIEDRALSVGSPITVKADVDEARRSARSVVRSECVITTNEPRELSARVRSSKSR
jgi:hypothetical protein